MLAAAVFVQVYASPTVHGRLRLGMADLVDTLTRSDA